VCLCRLAASHAYPLLDLAYGGLQGVNCLRLLNEASAVALQYGLHRSAKGEFDDSKETFVMFLDMGYSSFT
jgi:molecular chaperone DnaK (HSP70)